MTTIKDITSYLESLAPLSLQEPYDNSGLIVGDESTEVKKVLVCLDSTEDVIDEALKFGCNLIIAHHPIIFGGLKKLNGKNYVERTVIKAIRSQVAIYAIHTNLDSIQQGVNAKIAEKLGLRQCRMLLPKENQLKKLVTFSPAANADDVRRALFDGGCGHIGNYNECSFYSEGIGTFRPAENANPYSGEIGKQNHESEVRIETIFESSNEANVIKALLKAHPYEEVAYDVYPLNNTSNLTGTGMIGEFDVPMEATDFLRHLKSSMQTSCIRHTKLPERKITKVAVCGGSGSFLLSDAIKNKADVFVTADFKYHQFFDADGQILIADIGHYESEQFTKELLHDLLVKKFSTFAVRLTEVYTNPVIYF